MAIMEISVAPLGTGSTSLSAFVAGCLELVVSSELRYRLTPMGTIVEGDVRELLDLARRLHEQPFSAGVSRVLTQLRIDDRRDRAVTMNDKVASVNEALAQRVGHPG